MADLLVEWFATFDFAEWSVIGDAQFVEVNGACHGDQAKGKAKAKGAAKKVSCYLRAKGIFRALPQLSIYMI